MGYPVYAYHKMLFLFYFYYHYTEYISCPLKTAHVINIGVLALTKTSVTC